MEQSSLEQLNSLNNAIETIYTAALNLIPEVGGTVATLVAGFWPHPGDQKEWESMIQVAESAIEAYVNEEITQEVLSECSATLQGVENVLTLYVSAAQNPDFTTSQKNQRYNDAVTTLVNAYPQFKLDGYQYALLSSYIQLVTLSVFLLRDGVQFTEELGFNDAESEEQQTLLTTLVDDANIYSARLFDPLMNSVTQQYGSGDNAWTPINGLNRFWALSVNDYLYYYNYLVDGMLNGPIPVNTREIYSDLFGSFIDNCPPISITSASDKPLIDGLQLWGYSNVDAVVQSYDGVWGPRLGDALSDGWGGSDNPPHGWNGPVESDNPVYKVSLRRGTGGWINAIQVTFKNLDTTNVTGGGDTAGNYSFVDWVFDGSVVSQIWMAGQQSKTNTNTYAADVAIVGFRKENSY